MGFRVVDLGIRVWGLGRRRPRGASLRGRTGLRVEGFRFRGSGFGVRGSGFGVSARSGPGGLREAVRDVRDFGEVSRDCGDVTPDVGDVWCLGDVVSWRCLGEVRRSTPRCPPRAPKFSFCAPSLMWRPIPGGFPAEGGRRPGAIC